MRFLIACDSFKGSLSSAQAATHIESGIRRMFPDAQIDAIPIADGGEGTAQALAGALGGATHTVRVYGPMGTQVEAGYSVLTTGEAVMDMASASGLTLVPHGKMDVLSASTYGTGQLMLAAMDQGCRHIFLGIGGSATNDGGLGMAQALGIRFLDAHGNILGGDMPHPYTFLAGKHLADVATIDCTDADPRLASTAITILCDVANPLCGPTGASAVFGPQKGASPEDIALLDAGLANLADVVKQQLHLDYMDSLGAGAAGGLGFGLMAFAHAKPVSGIDFLLQKMDFDGKARSADLVITGEGRLDGQTLYGKTLMGIARRSSMFGIPVVAIVGSIEGSIDAFYDAGIVAVEACVCAPVSLAVALEEAGPRLADAAERLFQALAVGMGLRRDYGPR